MSDYPTGEELMRIRKWDCADCAGLFEFMRDTWNETGVIRESNGLWTFITGGWSGNEDILEALSANLSAWTMTWQESHRGGKHVFEIPAYQRATPTPKGQPE